MREEMHCNFLPLVRAWRCARVKPITLRPRHVTLADWRAIYRGAPLLLDPTTAAGILAAARTVELIVSKAEPIYGINTGFGKLAGVGIEAGPPRSAADQHRSLACGRCRRTDASARRSVNDGVEARQPGTGCLRSAPGDRGDVAGDARSRLDPCRPVPRLSGCFGRSGAARTHGGDHDRCRRGHYA